MQFLIILTIVLVAVAILAYVVSYIFTTVIGAISGIVLCIGATRLYFKAQKKSYLDRIKQPELLVIVSAITIGIGSYGHFRSIETASAEKSKAEKQFYADAQPYVDAAIAENCQGPNRRLQMAQLNNVFDGEKMRSLGENAMIHTGPGVYQRAGDISKEMENAQHSAALEVSQCEREQREKIHANLRSRINGKH